MYFLISITALVMPAGMINAMTLATDCLPVIIVIR